MIAVTRNRPEQAVQRAVFERPVGLDAALAQLERWELLRGRQCGRGQE